MLTSLMNNKQEVIKMTTKLMYDANHYYTHEETKEEARRVQEVFDYLLSLPEAPRPIDEKYKDIPPLDTEVEVSEFNRVFPVKMDGTRTPGKVSVRKHTRQIGHQSK